MDKPLNVDADNSMINKTGDRYMFKFFYLTIKLFKYKSAAFLSVKRRAVSIALSETANLSSGVSLFILRIIFASS